MQVEVSADANLYEYIEQAFLILLVLGGAAFLLGEIMLGGTSVSSSSSPSRKYNPLPDSLDSNCHALGPQSTTQETLLRLVAPGKRRDRRISLRRKGNPVGIVVLRGEGAKAEPGLVMNRSKGGLCLSLACPMTVGTTLQVRTCHAPEAVPWIQVLVRHCAAKGERWHLGCQFLEEQPWSVLLLFG